MWSEVIIVYRQQNPVHPHYQKGLYQPPSHTVGGNVTTSTNYQVTNLGLSSQPSKTPRVATLPPPVGAHQHL